MAIMLGFPVADDWLAAGLPQEMYNSENLSGFRYQYTLSNSALKRSGLSSDGRACVPSALSPSSDPWRPCLTE